MTVKSLTQAKPLYRHTRNGVVVTIFYAMVHTSKKRGHKPPSFTLKELRDWILSHPDFNKLFNNWVLSGYMRLEKPSCDRKDDYAGYSLDGLDLMTWRENKLKGESDRKNGINNKVNKAVICVDSDGKETRFFSQSQAARELGLPQPNIFNCCSGKRKTVGGFKFKYAKA